MLAELWEKLGLGISGVCIPFNVGDAHETLLDLLKSILQNGS